MCIYKMWRHDRTSGTVLWIRPRPRTDRGRIDCWQRISPIKSPSNPNWNTTKRIYDNTHVVINFPSNSLWSTHMLQDFCWKNKYQILERVFFYSCFLKYFIFQFCPWKFNPGRWWKWHCDHDATMYIIEERITFQYRFTYYRFYLLYLNEFCGVLYVLPQILYIIFISVFFTHSYILETCYCSNKNCYACALISLFGQWNIEIEILADGRWTAL